MRCLKCGYVNFPGLRECKKCGVPLAGGAVEGGMAAKKPGDPVGPMEGGQRSRSSALRFDFDKPASGAPEPGGGIRTSGIDRGAKANPEDFLDRAFSREASPAALPHLESVPLNRAAVTPSASRTENAGGNFWEPRKAPPAVEFPGTRLIVNQDAGGVSELHAAPLGIRFLSGVVDLLILLAAAALFCGLFVAVGGKIERYPLAAAIGGFIALVWIFFYFGLFTAVALKTPGQSAMGL
ncbi:MAG: RDD family protein, partial [Acidobacteriota bacterium]|nr:RDD family protein [Acidobacteriota bacterium]